MSHASYLINLAAGDPVILDKSRDALVDEMLPRRGAGPRLRGPAPGRPRRRRAARTASTRPPNRCPSCTNARAACACGCCWRSPPARGAASAAGSRTWRRCSTRARGGDTHGDLLRHLPRPRVRPTTSAPRRATSGPSTPSRASIGLDRLRAFHLNDSKTPAGSRVDRHAEIGDGYLGLLPFWRLVNDAALRDRRRPCSRRRPGPTSSRRSRATWPACARSSARPARPGRPSRRRCPRSATRARGGYSGKPRPRRIYGRWARRRNRMFLIKYVTIATFRIRSITRPKRTWCSKRPDLERDQPGGRHHHQPLAPGVPREIAQPSTLLNTASASSA